MMQLLILHLDGSGVVFGFAYLCRYMCFCFCMRLFFFLGSLMVVSIPPMYLINLAMLD